MGALFSVIGAYCDIPQDNLGVTFMESHLGRGTA
jgi:hypothetical protein